MKNKVLEYIKSLIKRTMCIPFYIFRIFKIDNNKIFFMNYNGRGYGDNCKYIAEELLSHYDNIKMLWALSKYDSNMPKEIRQVKIYTLRWVYELITSKIWINNCRFPSYVRKRKGQYYIQVWHGNIVLKKIEFDAPLPKKYIKNAVNDNKMIDLMVSNSGYCTNLYRNAFKYKGNILEVGTPRNDPLLNSTTLLSNKVKKMFNITEKIKILLYAPTFRDDYSYNPYDIDFTRLKNNLENKYSCKWIIIVKLHPNIKNIKKVINIEDNYIINASDYSDMQELICACDILITDYSSIMFEAMIINKPVILYINDIVSYINERGFYFSLTDLPFSIANNNNDLESIINTNSLKKFTEKYSTFEKQIYLKETGTASKQVAKIIIDKIGESHE